MTYDIAAIAQQLGADREGEAPDLAWLERTWREPEAFWSELADYHASARAPRARSRPGERVDLYQDMVVRHLTPDRPALRWYDPRRGWQEMSFAELHARATRRAGEWAAQKVAAGATIALVLHVGPEYLVALVTALRLGLVVTTLPPVGESFLARRLKALDPAHIAVDPIHLPLIKGFEDRVLHTGIPSLPYPERWHAYAAGDVCGLVFSPLREPLVVPVKLTADVAYLSAVRDGLFAFSLRPGDHLAYPGAHPLQDQPALILTTLLAGATFLHLTLDDVKPRPRLLLDHPIRSLGVTTALRDIVVKAKLGPIKTWSHWFKNPEDPLDPDAWRAFVRQNELDETPASNLVLDAATGVCHLYSVRRPGGPGAKVKPRGADARVLPPAGKAFALYDTNLRGKEAPGGHGLYAPKPAKKPEKEGHVLLVRVGSEYLYGGTIDPRRDGRVYPRKEVVEAIADLPFVTGATIVDVIAGGSGARSLFDLVVFTGAEDPAHFEKAEPERLGAIKRQITAQVGDDALPDRIALFPLYARLLDEKSGKLNQGWCEAYYRSGRLTEKVESPMFRALTALRKRVVKDLAKA